MLSLGAVLVGSATSIVFAVNALRQERLAQGEYSAARNVVIYAGDLVQAQTYLDQREWQPAIDILSASIRCFAVGNLTYCDQ